MLAIPLACTLVTAAQAQIRTDGTLGPAVALSGPNFLINEALGRLAGSNLFHSFQVFNVGSAESAAFLTTTPGLANVISRVTGGGASQINGLVKLDAANAAPNFFFINPAGVVFGNGAKIDVPAGFHVSTANYLKFPDGNFYADPKAASTLSSAAPEAFGFLGTTRAAIAIRDGALLRTTSPDADQPIGIVAGDIEIDGAQVRTGGSDMRAIAVGSGVREVGLTGALPDALGKLSVLNGGFLFSKPSGATKAGDILVAAGEVLIDGGADGNGFTGLISRASQLATGDAGSVTIRVAGPLTVVNGGAVNTDTLSVGRGGTIRVSAGALVIDGSSISSSALSGSGGDTGNIDVAVAGALVMASGGKIGTDTASTGRAGGVTVTAGDIAIDGAGSGRVTGIASQALSGAGNAGSVDVAVRGSLSIVNGGTLDSSTFSSGRAGTIKVAAREIVIDDQGSRVFTGITSQAFLGTGDAGSIDVTASGALSIVNGGTIATSTYLSSGKAGTVKVTAPEIVIDGQGSPNSTGITSQAFFGTGNAGTVDVTASRTLSIVRGGMIDSSTFSSGQAGTVKVTAGTLSMASGGTISSNTESSENAGTVTVTAGHLSMASGGTISSNTQSSGNAGAVTVTAGDIDIDGPGSSSFTGITSQATVGTGNAGSIDVTVSGTLSIVKGGTIDSSTFASGQAGTVKVTAGTLSMASAGTISSNANGKSSGNAGAVTVMAGDIVIDDQGSATVTGITSRAFPSSTGNAGSIDVTASGTLSIVNGGTITTSTFASGKAGTVKVAAGEIVIDGKGSSGFTGITSQAVFGTGNAGSVDVTARGMLALVNAGTISSSTGTSGQAGTVRVTAGTLSGDSNGFVGALALAGSSGQTGTVTIQAGEGITLSNGASFSIRNGATVENPGSLTPTLLSVTAPAISLANGGQITAASSGNIAASNIAVNFGPQLTVSNASISTSAQDGNGGGIAVNGTGVLVLQNGQITTSVAGTKGNGGDIGIAAPILVMQTGFIQANTAAANASGGNVNIEVGTLLPSGGTLFVGGPTPYTFAPGVFGFNVIQAAAPTGVSGTIRIATPVLDITGSLSALPAGYLDAGGLGRSPCAIVGGSSLSQVGRGGLPPAAGDLLWIDPVLEFPAIPAAGSPGSGTWVPPHRAAGTNAHSRTTPCWS